MEIPHSLEEQSSNSIETVPAKSDFVMIPRSLFNNIVIAVASFVFGGLTVFLLTNQSGAVSRTELDQIINQAVTVALNAQGNAPASNTANASRRLDIRVDDDPAWGPEDAPVTIVEFSDFECPFCARFHAETYATLKETYGDRIRFVYRDYPLTRIHANAMISAQAANCANEQGEFWAYHDLLLTNQDQLDRTGLGNLAKQLGLDMPAFDECLDSGRYEQEVKADAGEGSEYGVQGTPTFFINGRAIVGAQPYETFASMIEEELAASQ